MTTPKGTAFESDDWLDIKGRCDAAGITVEERQLPSADTGPKEAHARRVVGILSLPNGSSHRRVNIFPSSFKTLRTIKFEDYAFLGDYLAILNRVTNTIEARVNMASYPSRVLTRIPGFEDLDEPSKANEDENEDDDEERVLSEGDSRTRNRNSPLPENWRIRISKGSAVIEVSPPTTEFAQLVGGLSRTGTFKLSGLELRDDADALDALESIGNAYAFELDVRTNIQLQLGRVRPQGILPRSGSLSERPSRFPESVYPKEPLELYQYGRSSSGLPLLQFLAYYQAVEFFFPVYARQEAMRRMRLAIKDPLFDVNDDVSLNRVLAATIPEGRIKEREQLRTTLRACMEPSMIREIIESSEEYAKHFTGKDQAIKGAPRILLHQGHPDLRDQASDRIYAIRCRVVHTKQDGGEDSVDLLLPSSPEARSMGPDVDLMRSVAQRVLTASSRTLRPRYL